MADKLTPKQARFVEEYLVDLNGTQAAIRAGYSRDTADVIASQNLGKPNISEAIAEARAKLSQRTEITQDRVLRELAKIGFADLRVMFTEDGKLRHIGELGHDHSAAISSIEVVTRTIPGRDDAPAEVEHTHKIRAWDKVSALEKIGKHLGMFVDQKQTLGADGKPIDPRQSYVWVVQK